ncbi:hypothetical protein ACLOJK_039157, partial [Asimina triloba]
KDELDGHDRPISSVAPFAHLAGDNSPSTASNARSAPPPKSGLLAHMSRRPASCPRSIRQTHLQQVHSSLFHRTISPKLQAPRRSQQGDVNTLPKSG